MKVGDLVRCSYFSGSLFVVLEVHRSVWSDELYCKLLETSAGVKQCTVAAIDLEVIQ